MLSGRRMYSLRAASQRTLFAVILIGALLHSVHGQDEEVCQNDGFSAFVQLEYPTLDYPGAVVFLGDRNQTVQRVVVEEVLPPPTPTDPTLSPTPVVTGVPTPMATESPTSSPTEEGAPTPVVTGVPTPMSTESPTSAPTEEGAPTPVVTGVPTPMSTESPTLSPTEEGTPPSIVTIVPTPQSTGAPSAAPTPSTTNFPTLEPTIPPTPVSTVPPTPVSTGAPTLVPTPITTSVPTSIPTPSPTAVPTSVPSPIPSPVPTVPPSAVPTAMPTPEPTSSPTAVPTSVPSPIPSPVPTTPPSNVPTAMPTPEPTSSPTAVPTSVPSPIPSPVPTVPPSAVPTAMPTPEPTSSPTTAAVTVPPPTPVPTLPCLLTDTSVTTRVSSDRLILFIEDVFVWEDCQTHCLTYPDCTVWTWRHALHEDNPYLCDLFNTTNTDTLTTSTNTEFYSCIHRECSYCASHPTHTAAPTATPILLQEGDGDAPPPPTWVTTYATEEYTDGLVRWSLQIDAYEENVDNDFDVIIGVVDAPNFDPEVWPNPALYGYALKNGYKVWYDANSDAGLLRGDYGVPYAQGDILEVVMHITMDIYELSFVVNGEKQGTAFTYDDFRMHRRVILAVAMASNATVTILDCTNTPIPTETGPPSPATTVLPNTTPAVTRAPTAVPTERPTGERPVLTKVQFSNDGTRIFVDFDEDIAEGIIANDDGGRCTAFFTQETINRLGFGVNCTWPFWSTLAINLGAQATIIWEGLDGPSDGSSDGSHIVFIENPPIHAWWSAGQTDQEVRDAARFVPRNPYRVEYPENPTPPMAVLDAPTHASSCEDFEIDSGASTGLAGRLGNVISWSNCTGFPRFRSQYLSVLTVSPNQVFDRLGEDEYTDCTFYLEITNFLEVSSEVATATVKRSLDDVVLKVVLSAPPGGVWTRSEELVLYADAEAQFCGALINETDNPVLAYAWSVRSLPAAELQLDETSRPELYIPAGQLEVQVTYIFTVTVSTTIEGGYSEDVDIELTIQPSDLVAGIVGSDSRVASTSSTLELDGSASYDPDDDDAELMYTWQCEVEQTSGSTVPCEGLTDADLSSASPLLLIDGDKLAGDTTYLFSLTVSPRNQFDGRRATAPRKIRVMMFDEEVLTVSITGERQLPRHRILRLEGVAVPSGDSSPREFEYSYEWSEPEFAANSENAVDFEDDRVRLGYQSRNLVIDPGLLIPSVTYVFELTVVARSRGRDYRELRGVASISVEVLPGPVISDFSSTHVSSASVVQFYLLEVDAFSTVSGASPFQYRFASVTTSPFNTVEKNLLSDYSFQSFLEVPLLPGERTIEATVVDRFGSIATETLTVDVPGIDPDVECDLSELLNRLEQALVSEDTNALLLISTLSGTLQDSFYDSCRPRDLVETLFDAVRRLLRDTVVILPRGQLLADSMAVLSLAVDEPVLRHVQAMISATDVLLEFSNDHVEDGSLSEAIDVADKVGVVLDTVLTRAKLEDAEKREYCVVINTIEQQLRHFFALQLGPLLAGETSIPDAGRRGAGLAGGVTRVDVSDEGVGMSGGSEELSFSANVKVDADSGEVDLVVVALDAGVKLCFEDSRGIVPSGPVTIIEAPGSQVTEVDFELQVVDGRLLVGTCGGAQDEILECGFMNVTTNEWDTRGCQTIDTDVLDDGTGKLTCKCNHLTTFAVIKSLRDAACTRFSSAVLVVFILLYSFMLVTSGAQLNLAQQIIRDKTSRINVRLTRDTLVVIFFLCISQLVWMLVYLLNDSIDGSVPIVAFFVNAARVLMYFVFSAVLYQWLSIVTLEMNAKKHQGPKAIRISGMTGVAIASAALLATGIAYAITNDRAALTAVEQAGNALLAIVNLSTMIMFLVSGCLLVRKVSASSQQSGAVAGSESGDESQRLRKKKPSSSLSSTSLRIVKITLGFCFVFLVQTALILVAVFAPQFWSNNFVTFMSSYLVFDLAALGIVFYICYSVVKVYEKTKRARNSGSNRGATDSKGSATGDTTVRSANTHTRGSSGGGSRMFSGVSYGDGGRQTGGYQEMSTLSSTSYSRASTPSAFSQTVGADYIHSRNSSLSRALTGGTGPFPRRSNTLTSIRRSHTGHTHTSIVHDFDPFADLDAIDGNEGLSAHTQPPPAAPVAPVKIPMFKRNSSRFSDFISSPFSRMSTGTISPEAPGFEPGARMSIVTEKSPAGTPRVESFEEKRASSAETNTSSDKHIRSSSNSSSDMFSQHPLSPTPMIDSPIADAAAATPYAGDSPLVNPPMPGSPRRGERKSYITEDEAADPFASNFHPIMMKTDNSSTDTDTTTSNEQSHHDRQQVFVPSSGVSRHPLGSNHDSARNSPYVGSFTPNMASSVPRGSPSAGPRPLEAFGMANTGRNSPITDDPFGPTANSLSPGGNTRLSSDPLTAATHPASPDRNTPFVGDPFADATPMPTSNNNAVANDPFALATDPSLGNDSLLADPFAASRTFVDQADESFLNKDDDDNDDFFALGRRRNSSSHSRPEPTDGQATAAGSKRRFSVAKTTVEEIEFSGEEDLSDGSEITAYSGSDFSDAEAEATQRVRPRRRSRARSRARSTVNSKKKAAASTDTKEDEVAKSTSEADVVAKVDTKEDEVVAVTVEEEEIFKDAGRDRDRSRTVAVSLADLVVSDDEDHDDEAPPREPSEV